MKKKFYNVWFNVDNHWTGYVLDKYGCGSAPENPIPLSKQEAHSLLLYVLSRGNSQTEYEIREIEFSKVVPDIPLDPTLHILQAGYIQDRQRKRS